jgi:hypothetical protein
VCLELDSVGTGSCDRVDERMREAQAAVVRLRDLGDNERA